jgi:hypothetical protein
MFRHDIRPSDEIETNARHTETRNSAARDCANSDEKAHYGLGVSRSEERDVEYKRDWNTVEGYLPNLNEVIRTATQLTAGQMLDESQWLGSQTGAEAETRSSRWFRSASN